MTKKLTQRVVFQPQTRASLKRGSSTLVAAIRPTLGPRPRLVALERSDRSRCPELLDDAGLIARRLVEIPNRDDDMGAMLVRQMLWRVHEHAGDGSATAAILFESIFNLGLTYIVAGGNAMRLRRDLEAGLRIVLEQLAAMTQPLRGRRGLAAFAHTVCHDSDVAHLLGEVFDIIGGYGRLDIRESQGRSVEREYIEGMYWDAAPHSRDMLTGSSGTRVDLENVAILVTDLNIADGGQLIPLLEAAAEASERVLLLICQSLAPSALGLLAANSRPGGLQVVAVHTPYAGTKQQAALEDLALLTGARPFLQAAGDSILAVKREHFGHARRAWADKDYFGIIGGRGDSKVLRRHLSSLRACIANTSGAEARQALRERLGKLIAGSATLWVGGATQPEIAVRTELTKRTAEAVRGALMEGVVPGGGVALLDCRPALRSAANTASDAETRVAYQILARALEAPARAIITNAGGNEARVMAELDRAGSGFGFEVHGARIVAMAAAGIVDAASVMRVATMSAVTTAALALTTDVLVHHAKPVKSFEP